MNTHAPASICFKNANKCNDHVGDGMLDLHLGVLLLFVCLFTKVKPVLKKKTRLKEPGKETCYGRCYL